MKVCTVPKSTLSRYSTKASKLVRGHEIHTASSIKRNLYHTPASLIFPFLSSSSRVIAYRTEKIQLVGIHIQNFGGKDNANAPHRIFDPELS